MTLSALFRQCPVPVYPNDVSDIVGCCTKKGPHYTLTTSYYTHVRRVLVSQDVPVSPVTCGNLTLSGGPPLSTDTLTVHSKGG